ncbi:MAG: cupin domain-containing protein [Phycisphaerales bacterium]
MQTTTMNALSELWSDGGLLQLDASPIGKCGEDGLAQLFEIGRSAVRILRHHCQHKSPDGRACFVGQLPGWIEGAKLRAFMHRIELQHPIRPEAPFEGTARIAGAAWLASRELGDDADDGIAKLCFAPNTANLPLHTHEQSERFIFCLQGRGTFHYCRTALDEFDGSGTREVPIRAGSFVLFSRKVLHTFSSCRPGVVLISYQSPSLAFDDPDQYTLPTDTWTPSRERLSVALHCRSNGVAA